MEDSEQFDYTNSSDYYYDYNNLDKSLSPDELKEYIPIAICYGIIFLLGITGNSLVIYCIAKYKRMKSITNQLLLSLACADLLLTLICVPIKVSVIRTLLVVR